MEIDCFWAALTMTNSFNSCIVLFLLRSCPVVQSQWHCYSSFNPLSIFSTYPTNNHVLRAEKNRTSSSILKLTVSLSSTLDMSTLLCTLVRYFAVIQPVPKTSHLPLSVIPHAICHQWQGPYAAGALGSSLILTWTSLHKVFQMPERVFYAPWMLALMVIWVLLKSSVSCLLSCLMPVVWYRKGVVSEHWVLLWVKATVMNRCMMLDT